MVLSFCTGHLHHQRVLVYAVWVIGCDWVIIARGEFGTIPDLTGPTRVNRNLRPMEKPQFVQANITCSV